LEEYSATHSETVEELLEWPALRFERFYEAYSNRQAINDMKLQKICTIAATHANSNYDGEENSDVRGNIADALEKSFKEAVKRIYIKGPTDEDKLDEYMKEDPLFAKSLRATEE
jgi:hypothetical protein